jgi:hypothetical protein
MSPKVRSIHNGNFEFALFCEVKVIGVDELVHI